jgi:hypothetical protein
MSRCIICLCLLFVMMSVMPVCAQQKLSPKIINRSTRISNKEMIYSVTCQDGSVFKQKYSERTTILYHYPATNTFRVRALQTMVKEMEADANVVFMDIQQRPATEGGTDITHQSYNRIRKVHDHFPDLRGAGISVSIKENRFDTANIDLVNRSFETSVSSSFLSQHATAMATLIAGGENSAPTARGVVPAARITSADFENILPDPDTIFTRNDIRLQNHSYGVEIENYYGNEAAAYDQQMVTNPGLMHVFSVGNLGTQSPDYGAYKGMNLANLSGNFKQAKNPLVVNAVDTTRTVNAANSRGPAYDGRLKPELTAFGQDGTSDACALATGVAALLQQAYYKVYSTHPPAAVLKAVLVASADDVGPKGIDFTYGYGSINADQAVQVIVNQQLATVALTSQEQQTIPITVPANTATLQIAVTWTDPAAQPGSPQALVNNIDAYLSHAGNTWHPWVLSSYPHRDSLAAPAKRRKDSLNAVEYITLTAPPEGVYNLIVKAPTLVASQAVAVAYWFEKDVSFQWDYPVAKETLQSDKNVALFWKAYSTLPGTLSLQLKDGDWKTIQQNVPLQVPFSWHVPDTLARARLKMTVGTKDFISGVFDISPQLQMKVAFHCEERFALAWNPVPGAQQYELYTMGERYLEKLLTTADTLATLSKTSTKRFFAVAPVVNNTASLKSQTIDYTVQGVQCYVNLFEATRYDATHVQVQLNLSTIANIDHIIIHKTTNQQQQILATQAAGHSVDLQWFDDELVAGAMEYHAEIVLKDGLVIVSDPTVVTIEEKGKANLFPNPVSAGEPFYILSEGLGCVITIFDNTGKFVYSQELMDVLDVINLPALRPGLYLYQFQEPSGSVVDCGKFVRR